jgi:RNA polymerase sigma-70 factor (ECF subfamily)
MSGASRETRWSLVTRAQGDTPAARLALSELCEIYYAPVLAYVRTWAGTDEAHDLTHAFFETVLAGGSLEQAREERGRFRSYLLGAAKHFLCETRAKQSRLKRGDRHDHIELDAGSLGDPKSLPPDEEFDRAWACALIDRCLSRLSAEMNNAGKGATFEVLRPWLVGTSTHGDQREVAGRLGLGETAIRVLVHRLRKRFRELIEEEVTQTLEPEEDLLGELRHLLGAC